MNWWNGREWDGELCGLTFELSGRRRQDALARTEKMYRVPQAGPRWPAVGAPLERGVRPQCGTHRVCLLPFAEALLGPAMLKKQGFDP
jgi:hypothetical protein